VRQGGISWIGGFSLLPMTHCRGLDFFTDRAVDFNRFALSHFPNVVSRSIVVANDHMSHGESEPDLDSSPKVGQPSGAAGLPALPTAPHAAGMDPHRIESQAASRAPGSPADSSAKSSRWGLRAIVMVIAVGAAVYFGIPVVTRALNTVSTDDAYVNSHVTFVAPRVAGQVVKVLVDDNNRVRQGDLVVQLDKEPYQVQLNIKKAAEESAVADLAVARDQVRAQAGLARSNRFKLQHAIEQVNNQIALLRANVATWDSKKATLVRAQADFERGQKLLKSGNISREEFDRFEQVFRVSEADVKQTLEAVYQIRVGLGLPAQPDEGKELTDVPDDLDQTFSAVRQAVGELLQSVAPLGIYPPSYDATPKQIVESFYKRDPKGDIDRIYAELLQSAPAVKQAEAKLLQAKRDVDQAELNLRYCDVFAEIDGVVTRRNVNAGNNVQAGQGLMALRSLTEIWVDANFKETQLANLRIGQRVELEIDMYGGRRTFEGRVSGFTMGTGSTLSLLPAQNATGNFIKVVQRLPVRIEVVDYKPDEQTLFVGLSVVPYVDIKKAPTGPDAGKLLQPYFFTASPFKATSAAGLAVEAGDEPTGNTAHNAVDGNTKNPSKANEAQP
jgi:membrane fusion protein (multidrug efflux system)